MTILSSARAVTGGVDTHLDQHVAAVVPGTTSSSVNLGGVMTVDVATGEIAASVYGPAICGIDNPQSTANQPGARGHASNCYTHQDCPAARVRVRLGSTC